jgi:hypothetical protein
MLPLIPIIIGAGAGLLFGGSKKKYAQGGEVLPNGTEVRFKDFKGNERSGQIIEHRMNGYVVATNLGHAFVMPREITSHKSLGGFVVGAVAGTVAGYKLRETYEVKKKPAKKSAKK